MQKIIIRALMFFFIAGAATAQEPEWTLEEQEYIEWAEDFWQSLQPRQGEIELLNGQATLQVPENFYYLSPEDTERVLVEAWGNPPGTAGDTLGMLFPSEYTPFDDASWGVTIEYLDDGYVSDDDAGSIDYSDLLRQMKKETREASKLRVEQGYEPIELVGWAVEPFYDQQTHKLHWAREIRFGEQQPNTLNYNIRILGRKGVLILNFVAGMDQLEVINTQMDSVLALADFDAGSRYDDFNPDIDKVAAYGLGALVAGKVLAKTGLLAALLIFLKKFGVIILVGLGALAGKVFGRKKTGAAE